MHRYEIILYWSNEDQAFIAEAPELPGCMRMERIRKPRCGMSRTPCSSGSSERRSWDGRSCSRRASG